MAEAPFDVRLEVARVLEAEPFERARKPGMVTLTLDLGDRELASCAQLAANYDPGELVGRQVLCATNLGTVTIAGFESQALTVGVPDGDGDPVLVVPDHDVPLGGTVH
jgi:tRNA-binding protein